MRTYHDCIPCFVRQALDAARRVTDDEQVHEKLVRETLKLASTMPFDKPPPWMGQQIHRMLREAIGQQDPYRVAKRGANGFALRLLPELRGVIGAAEDPFEAAVRMAIAGNVVDLGVKSELSTMEIQYALEAAMKVTLEGDAVDHLNDRAEAAERILYLADNAGEIVFDRLLIELLPIDRVTLVVKGAPIINDATREDAETAGLTELVDVIDNGSDAPGTILEDCSPAFGRCFDEADLIISKGQGNYETLSGVDKEIFFLLKVKCPVIARDLGYPVGRLVLHHSPAAGRTVSDEDVAFRV